MESFYAPFTSRGLIVVFALSHTPRLVPKQASDTGDVPWRCKDAVIPYYIIEREGGRKEGWGVKGKACARTLTAN